MIAEGGCIIHDREFATEINKGIDISKLTRGTYFVHLTDKNTKSISTRKFIKQ